MKNFMHNSNNIKENSCNTTYNFATDIFPRMQQLILDAFQLDTYYYTYPYESFDFVDHGFRKLVWQQYNAPTFDFSPNQMPGGYRLVLVKSNLQFYNVLIFTSEGPTPSFVATAPLSDKSITNSEIQKLFSDANVSPDFLKLAYDFYHEMPVLSLVCLCSFITHFLEDYIPQFSGIIPEFIDYSYTEHSYTVIRNADIYNDFNAQSAIQYTNYLHGYLDAVATGDLNCSQIELHKLMNHKKIDSNMSLFELKKQTSELNILCKGKLLCASVHPFNVLTEFSHFEYLIQTANYGQQLTNLMFAITRKYCLLVKNFSFSDYSYTTRNIINYISAHLNDDLSLSIIASNLEKNASTISAQFSKETGKSVTDMIHEMRIKEALRYFNTTELSVSEVATRVIKIFLPEILQL